MGLFDGFGHKEAEADPLTGGADGFFDVLDDDGRLLRRPTTSTRSGRRPTSTRP